jgi:hypothetical protein
MTRVTTPSDLHLTIRRTPECQQAIHGVAVQVHAAAVRRATPHADTGEYLRLLVVEDRDEFGSAVVAGAFYSNFVEYGTCSRRLPIAPTPCPHDEPKKLGILPQLIMTGACQDVTQ